MEEVSIDQRGQSILQSSFDGYAHLLPINLIRRDYQTCGVSNLRAHSHSLSIGGSLTLEFS